MAGTETAESKKRSRRQVTSLSRQASVFLFGFCMAFYLALQSFAQSQPAAVESHGIPDDLSPGVAASVLTAELGGADSAPLTQDDIVSRFCDPYNVTMQQCFPREGNRKLMKRHKHCRQRQQAR